MRSGRRQTVNEMRGTTRHFVASRRCSFRQRTHRLDLRHQRVVALAGVGGRHGGGPEQTLALGCGLHAFAVLPRRASRARARRRDGNRRQHERRSHGRRGGRAPARRVASHARHPLAVHAQGLLVGAVDAPGHSNEVPLGPRALGHAATALVQRRYLGSLPRSADRQSNHSVVRRANRKATHTGHLACW